MLIITHLIITIFFILVFIDGVESGEKLIFILVALVSTYLPDIDLKTSKLGKKIIFRPLQLFVKHRGGFHSFTFLGIISFLMYIFYPIIMFPFILGYGLHLIADGLTKQGIKPFYPFKKKISWRIRTGGRFETVVFVIFLIGSLWLFLRGFLTIF